MVGVEVGAMGWPRGAAPGRVGYNIMRTGWCRGSVDLYSIATGTWYNARVSKSPCEYKIGAVTFYFAELERPRDQKGVALS